MAFSLSIIPCELRFRYQDGKPDTSILQVVPITYLFLRTGNEGRKDYLGFLSPLLWPTIPTSE